MNIHKLISCIKFTLLKTVAIILFICWLCPLKLLAQNNPPLPPPPPQPAYDIKTAEEKRLKDLYEAEKARQKAMEAAKKKSMEKEKSPTGFKSIRIPTLGEYQLGMTKKEFDSLSKLDILKIKAGDTEYPVDLEPSFSSKRLSALFMKSTNGEYKTDIKEFVVMFALDYRYPDSVSNKDSLISFPDSSDSSLKGQYLRKETEWIWRNKYYDMIVHFSRIEMDNATWKGNFFIRFNGNKDYIELLKSVKD